MLPSRWSPAHHRVLQYLLPCLRRHRRQPARTTLGQPGQRAVRVGHRPRQHLCHGCCGGPGQRAQCAERGPHPYVRPVQQPGHDQRGSGVHRRHCRPGVMPGVAVAGGSGHAPGVHRVLWHGHRGVAVRIGQREVQYPLHRQGEGDGGDRRVAASCQRPDRRELRQDQHGHQPPGHRAFDDRVVPEGREHGAEPGEQTGPRVCSRVAGPACSGTSLVPGQVIRRHGRGGHGHSPCRIRRGGWGRSPG